MNAPASRELARSIFMAGVTAALPGAGTRRALAGAPAPRSPVHILALGKAGTAMAAAAIERLAACGAEPAGGVVIGTTVLAAPHPSLRGLAGNHPVPGPASLAAAAALGAAVRSVAADDECWVLLSGGTSSLIAAPVGGVREDDLVALFDALQRSGLDIVDANRIRKQFLRWGAGRLAADLAPACVRVLIASDVLGDDPGTIGSGPCTADDTPRADVAEQLRMLAGQRLLTAAVAGRLAAALAAADLPLARRDPTFDRVHTTIVAGIGDAVAGAANAARRAGWDARAAAAPLVGEAQSVAESITREAAARGAGDTRPRRCTVHGGETTVSLGNTAVPAGGRSQELALAAARALAGIDGIVLLAAGTDGRDGPTDAAGAIVDGTTWAAIRASGRDPDADLAAHRSHAALDAAGALIRTGPTGTNVGDLVILLEG